MHTYLNEEELNKMLTAQDPLRRKLVQLKEDRKILYKDAAKYLDVSSSAITKWVNGTNNFIEENLILMEFFIREHE